MTIGSMNLNCKEKVTKYEVRSKLWPLENYYMFNSKGDNLKILIFKSLFAGLCVIIFNIY